MTDEDREKENRKPALFGPLLVLALLVVGALFVLFSEGAPKERPSVVTTEEVAPAAPPPAPAPSMTPPLEYAADGLPYKPKDPSVSPDPEGPMHPHAHTPEHERIYRENNLFGAISGAMDRLDTKGMRELLAEYKADYPEDSHLLQTGFEIIADCIDHPGERSRAAARDYYKNNKASNIRRYVRRHCFADQPVK